MFDRSAAAAATVFADVEPLEPRRLLSASFAGGVLSIRGTSSDDVISLAFNPEETRIVVSDNGAIRRFNISDVHLIVIAGREGNDSLSLASNVWIPADLYGQSGFDTLVGGAGRDRLFGGD